MRLPARPLCLALSIAAAAVAACSVPTGPHSGALAVLISAPNGVVPAVSVHGPGGFTKSLTASATLPGLATGTYTVTAAPVTIADSIAGSIFVGTISGTPVSVVRSKTPDTVVVSYGLRPGTGALWVATFGGFSSIAEYLSEQLGKQQTDLPATSVAAQGVFGATFDAAGNLWVPLFTSNAVEEFTAAQLSAANGSSTPPSPAVTLIANAGSLNSPAALAFDANGNLWVTNVAMGANTVVEYSASQILTDGSPIPAVTIGSASGSLNQPFGIAFDAGGNLWIGNDDGQSTVVEFTASQLAQSGTPVPVVTITPAPAVFLEPQGMAFDSHGGLWIASGFTNTIVELSASQLTTTSAPDPAVFLTASSGSLDDPAGVAFDNSGDLWVSNFQGNASIVEFSKGQLASSGHPQPTVRVSSLNGPIGIAFNPHAASLPLKP